MKEALGYLKDEILGFPDWEDSAGAKPWLISVALLAFTMLFMIFLSLIYQFSELLSWLVSMVSAPFLIMFILRGAAGTVISFAPFVKSFFPYTMQGIGYAFTHASAEGGLVRIDSHSGQRVYWTKKFLTRWGAERFIDTNSNLSLKRTDKRTFFVWDSDID